MFTGIAIGTIGVDPLYGVARFSFGFAVMESGIDFVVVMIGLFAVSEVIVLLATDRDLRNKKPDHKGLPISLRDIWRLQRSILRGTGIRCLTRVVPGAGATQDAVLDYGVAKQLPRTRTA